MCVCVCMLLIKDAIRLFSSLFSPPSFHLPIVCHVCLQDSWAFFFWCACPCHQLCKRIRVPLRAVLAHAPPPPPPSCAFFRLGEYLKRQGTGFSSQRGFCSGYLASCTPPLCPPCCLTDGTDSNRDAHRCIKRGHAVRVLQGDTSNAGIHTNALFAAADRGCLSGNLVLVLRHILVGEKKKPYRCGNKFSATRSESPVIELMCTKEL